MGLFNDFLSNGEKPTFKWLHYFPIYEEYFSKYVNQSVKLLEIGVLDGGSLAMWRNYFGPHAEIVGIDINQDAKRHEGLGVSIEIGNQSDYSFLEAVERKYGQFDIIIDDGSHIQSDVISTLSFFLDKMPRNSVYLIEDTHMSNVPGFTKEKNDIFSFLSPINRELSDGYVGNEIQSHGSKIYSINYFDSVIVLQFKSPFLRKALSLNNNSERVVTNELDPGFM
jgi:hypothetical protein